MKNLRFTVYGLQLTLALLLCASCNQNRGKIPIAGTIDSNFIAQDTAMQLGIESSYEYHKTIQVWNEEVIDIVAWGGELALIFRYRNESDTLIKAKRNGVVINTIKTDLNKNNNPELLIILQNPGVEQRGDIIGYELGRGKPIPLLIENFHNMDITKSYRGRDSIYIDSNMVIRRFPLYLKNDLNCCPTGGKGIVHYMLVKNRLVKVDYLEQKEP